MLAHTRLTVVSLALWAAGAVSYVLLPFTTQPLSAIEGLSRRDPYQEPLLGMGHVYIVSVAVGTPPQRISIRLSPSTSYSWIPSAQGLCDDGSTSVLCPWGSYNMSASSTARRAAQGSQDFSQYYEDGTFVTGDNMTDRLVLGRLEINNYPLGLVTFDSRNQYVGSLGLGSNLYDSHGAEQRSTFTTLMDHQVSSGQIASAGYSIWLNDAGGKDAAGNSGRILFGAVDRSHYEGDLIRIHAPTEYPSTRFGFWVTIKSITATGNKDMVHSMPTSAAAELPVSVMVDPSDTYSYLPAKIVDSIMDLAGAIWNTTLQRAMVPCDLARDTTAGAIGAGEIRLQLKGEGGPIITARISDLVIPQDVTARELVEAVSGKQLDPSMCVLGVQKFVRSEANSTGQTNSYNLGGAMLKRTYLVYDNVNREMAFAPVKWSIRFPEADELVPFARNGARIPVSKKFDCTKDGCSFTCDDEDDCESFRKMTSQGSDEGGTPVWKNVLIGVFVPLGLLSIAAAIYFIVRRMRKGKKTEKDKAVDDEASGAGDGPVMTGALGGKPPIVIVSPPQRPLPALPVIVLPSLPAIKEESVRTRSVAESGAAHGEEQPDPSVKAKALSTDISESGVCETCGRGEPDSTKKPEDLPTADSESRKSQADVGETPVAESTVARDEEGTPEMDKKVEVPQERNKESEVLSADNPEASEDETSARQEEPSQEERSKEEASKEETSKEGPSKEEPSQAKDKEEPKQQQPLSPETREKEADN
ncbi:aspartic peptidase domain-containing protein [Echria macrotheca]|uniref:Aspartic peptidase domain-containing protein n=1 Tax=Echria macrotheca TaxID=438768 RepID=A0AAJ0BDY2_9PEZI|nr:aspartic peptidase domain-containing protein [Echria macrotheca]